ncbi:SsgA family sporulation/cell division regulator [Streptomyces sp. NPDC052015]|uniref:SsgA family sporulation/cell division regulator n=1 Tax=Streptomyces sp. NPDC052015 TaxID=3154755 RepID=UPI0034275D87
MDIIEHDTMAGVLVDNHGQSGPVAVMLRYDTSDPLAVGLVFGGGDQPGITWVFARDLLSAGTREVTGSGDVRVSPSSWQTTDVELRSPEGSCRVRFFTDELQDFLQRTIAVCPPGSERCRKSLERMLQGLLRPV